MGLRAFASGPTLALQPEMDAIAWGSKGKDTRYLGKPHRAASRSRAWLRNGRNEVSSNGGKQLIPADGV